MSKLTDTKIKSFKVPKDVGNHLDGNYLYVVVSPKGLKSFKVVYTYFDNQKKQKQKTCVIGRYPDMSLKEARDEAKIAVDTYKNGDDYAQVLKDKKREAKTDNSFKYWSNEWLKTRINKIDEKSYKNTEGRLKNHILPTFGKKKITDIKPKDVIALIRLIGRDGAIETSKRCKQIISQIFNYCIIHEVCSINPTIGIDSVLQKAASKSMPTITNPKMIGQLLRDIETYKNRGRVVTWYALKMMPYLMLRPNEVYESKWEYIDFENKIWKIPAEQMKMSRDHLVPLSDQVVVLLRELFEITGHEIYIFPSNTKSTSFMSNNTVNMALKRLGYERKIVPHGFRGMASTLLNEQGYNSDWIEKQLAHEEGNSIRRAYNHAEYLDDRRMMLQEWADYLDVLRSQSVK
ncbi:tyrosine-type recombinase/integrase [Wohlfahrtiimonas populi]|uniref:tyrosine-type recombinase/integrase n=1 Tax=Wohlfahrtiimonas populi TaxID=1940240 RepID=UPI00098D5327|nr:tyrosine-type recombinase/integrase [Wohlfahrtiimonas populi]